MLDYIKSWFFIDALALIPIDKISNDGNTQVGRLIKLLKLQRLIRLTKLSKIISSINTVI